MTCQYHSSVYIKEEWKCTFVQRVTSVTAASVIIVKWWKQPKFPADNWVNKWDITQPQKGKKVLILMLPHGLNVKIHYAKWKTQRITIIDSYSQYMIPFTQNVQKRQIHRNRKLTNGCQGLGEGKKEWLSGYKTGGVMKCFGVRSWWGLYNFVNTLNPLNWTF